MLKTVSILILMAILFCTSCEISDRPQDQINVLLVERNDANTKYEELKKHCDSLLKKCDSLNKELQTTVRFIQSAKAKVIDSDEDDVSERLLHDMRNVLRDAYDKPDLSNPSNIFASNPQYNTVNRSYIDTDFKKSSRRK